MEMASTVLHVSPVGYSVFAVSKISLGNQYSKLAQFPVFSRTCNLVSFFPLPFGPQTEENYQDLSQLADGQSASSLENFLLGVLDPGCAVQVGSKSLAEALRKTPVLNQFRFFFNEKFSETFRYLDQHFHRYLPDKARSELSSRRKALAMYIFRRNIAFDAEKSDENLVQLFCVLRELENSYKTFLLALGKLLQGEGCLSVLDKTLHKLQEKTRKTGVPNGEWQVPQQTCTWEDCEKALFDFLVLVQKKEADAFADLFLGTESDKALKTVSKFLQLDKEVLANEVRSFGKRVETSAAKSLVEKTKTHLQNVRRFQRALKKKAKHTVPNLTKVVGCRTAALLVEKAGSLLKLSMLHSNFIQLLGAEKELFKALKTRSNTPKFGVLGDQVAESTRTGLSNKGMLCRVYSNKCALAARMDAYGKDKAGKYGKVLKKEIEQAFQKNSVSE